MRDRDGETPLLVQRARAINAIVFGGGQVVVAILLLVAAREIAPLEAPWSAVSPRLVVAMLIVFALLAGLRGARQLTTGLGRYRDLRDAERRERDREPPGDETAP